MYMIMVGLWNNEFPEHAKPNYVQLAYLKGLDKI